MTRTVVTEILTIVALSFFATAILFIVIPGFTFIMLELNKPEGNEQMSDLATRQLIQDVIDDFGIDVLKNLLGEYFNIDIERIEISDYPSIWIGGCYGYNLSGERVLEFIDWTKR